MKLELYRNKKELVQLMTETSQKQNRYDPTDDQI